MRASLRAPSPSLSAQIASQTNKSASRAAATSALHGKLSALNAKVRPRQCTLTANGRHAVFDRKELNLKTSNVALLTGFDPVMDKTRVELQLRKATGFRF